MTPRRSWCGLAVLAALFLPTAPALSQDAPPHEDEGRLPAAAARPPAPARPLAPKPPGQPGQMPARPPAQAQKPAPAKPAPRGPAVQNDGKRYLRSLDGDHDGRITREEFLARARKRFEALDQDRNGTISAQEARTGKAKLAERRAKAEARRTAQGRPAKAGARGGQSAKPYLSGLDKNSDGRVTLKEFLAQREKQFAELDRNRDGVITREEARAGKARLLERRAGRKAEARERLERRQAAAKAQASAPGPEAQDIPARTPAPGP